LPPGIIRRDGTKNLYFKFTYLGVEVRETAHTRVRALAERTMALIKERIYREKKLGEKPKEARPITVRDACGHYYDDRLAQNNSRRQQTDKSMLRQITAHFGADTLFGSIPFDKIRDWRDGLRTSGRKGKRSNETVNRLYICFRAMCYYIKDELKMDAPAEFVLKLLPEKATDIKSLTAEEEAALLVACPERIKEFCQVDIDTGFRKHELMALTPRWIAWAPRPAITVPAGVTKDHTARRVPIPPGRSVAILQRLCQGLGPDDLVFPEVTEQTLRIDFTAAVEKAGIKHATPHAMRHTYGFRLAVRGIHGDVIQKLMDHSDPKTTQRYTKHSPQLHDDAVDRALGTAE
jgi:integrase